MSLLNLLTDRRSKVTASANARIAELARKEATGMVTAKDAEELGELLAQARIDETEYATRVDVLARHHKHKQAGEALPAAKAAAAQAMDALDAKRARIKQAQLADEDELRELARDLANKQRTAKDMKHHAQEAQRLEVQFPEIFGMEPRDFDLCTPCFAGSTVSHYDRAAEKVEVPHAIYKREEARRGRIIERARARAIDEYKAAQEKWRASLPHDARGMPVASKADLANAPEFVAPTWAEIVAAGLHKTLDVPDRVNGRAA